MSKLHKIGNLNRARKAPPVRRTPGQRLRAALCESLESRVLLSAAVAAVPLGLDSSWLESRIQSSGFGVQGSLSTQHSALSTQHSPSPTQHPALSTQHSRALVYHVTTAQGYGFLAQYFSDLSFTNSIGSLPVGNVYFNWGKNVPAAGLTPGNFSVKYTAQLIVPITGKYIFYTNVLGGVRLSLNGQVLINHAVANPKRITSYAGHTPAMVLTAGSTYILEMDYTAPYVRSAAVLRWSGPKIRRQILPTSQAKWDTTGASSNTAPSNFAAAPAAQGVQLTWSINSTGQTSFQIDRSSDGGLTWPATFSASSAATSYNDLSALGAATYVYRIRALTPSGATPYSNNASITTPLAAPGNVTATALTGTAISLAWADTNLGEVGYEIDRSPDGNTWTPLTTLAQNATSYTDTGLANSTMYHYRIIALGLAATFAASAPVSATTAATDAPRYLLTPSTLATLRTAASNNTAQWQAFKANLDAGLNQVTEGDYQGAELPAISNYALGYQVLKDSDPTTAAKYADKAIAVMLLGLNGTQDPTDQGARMYLARGDGVTKSFALPNSNVSGATLKVWLPTVTVKAVTKGAVNGQDAVDYYYQFINVSNTPDGVVNYTQGVDWRYNPNFGRNQIDWSLGSSNQPATGSNYYVTEATTSGVGTSGGYTLNGNTITFTAAPGVNQAIFVQYQYNGPTLNYQQTNDGRGGFNNIQVDTGYTSRYLKNIAVGLDWLWSYQGLSQQLRSETMSMLVRWSDYLRDNGYHRESPASNYGAGHFAFRMATAIALQDRDLADAPRLMSEIQAYQTNNVLPTFQAPGAQYTDTYGNVLGTEQGGFWAEGWNYGPFAIQNVLTSELAYENAGWGSAATVKSWANDVITSLLEEQPTQSTIYDGGDGYAYPLPFPSKSLLEDVAFAATDTTLKSYANWAIQNYAGSTGNDWNDLLFRNPGASTASWTGSLPLQYLSQGTGLAVARKDWNYNSTWLSFHSGHLASADHQDSDQGALEIDRGADNLLINTAAFTGDQTFQNKSTYGNAVLIDDGGAGQQTYRFAQGVWYGNPGVTMPHFEGTSDFAYMQGNYAAAYTHNYGAPGSPNPASELVRDVFYVRGADYVIVYDRATTTQASFLKRLQWNFANAATMSGDSWVATAGSSKLFGQTFSDVPLTTTEQSFTLDGKTFQEIQTSNSSATASVRYVTALQTAPSSTGTMDSSAHVESGDGKLEGVQIGSYIVLFGKNGAVSGGSSYQFTATAGQTTTHYLSDMTPGATYTLTGANQGTATADAQGVLTFTTTGTGAAQTVAVTG